MGTSYKSYKSGYNTAQQFKESFFEPEPATLGYVIISDHVTSNATPNSIVDTVATEKNIWDNMIGGKRVTGNDISLVIPRVNWTGNTKYIAYDDTIEYSSLLIANTTQNLKPMYVMTSNFDVYKCLSNNNSANSTVEPTGTYTSSNGRIHTSTDNYVWQYMYNVKQSNKFLDNDWMPAPYSTSQTDFTVNTEGVVDGIISSTIVVNGGNNYTDGVNVTALTYPAGNSSIQFSNTFNLTANGFNLSNVVNMYVTGNGISSGTYVSSVSLVYGSITLSTPTSSSGNGQINFQTRVSIDGDGISATGSSVITNNSIARVDVNNPGSGYGYANVYVYGTGSGANVRAVLPPKYGHAYNPALELGANNAMISVIIGENDTSESGLISANTNFGTYGLLVNPYKYNETSAETVSVSNTVISQTTDVTVSYGSDYTLNEYVYQGSLTAPTFSGFVVDSLASGTIKLTNVRGTPSVGRALYGQTSGIYRFVVSYTNPEFEPYSGDILYAENVSKVQRVDGQSENIRLVFKF
jgi:hypothetical protein